MRLLLSAIAAIAFAMPATAQSSIVIEDVMHVSSYRNATIVLSNSDGLTFNYVLVPLTEFRLEQPNTLIWDAPRSGPEGLISPIVYTAIYTSVGGIRIIIQVPCSRYSSIKACAEAFAAAVNEMEKHFMRDTELSRTDTYIVIPKPGK